MIRAFLFVLMLVTAVIPLPASGPRPSAILASGTIAFERDTAAGPSVWLMTGDGRGQSLVPSGADASDPGWTPGGKLGFVTTRLGRFALYQSTASGTDVSPLTKDPLSKTKPAWSPNGKLIVFQGGAEGHSRLYLLSAQGGSPKMLTSGTSDDTYPSWAPDGRLVFSSNRDGHYRLYVLVIGKKPLRLTSGPGEDLEPRWAPDGRLVAFTRQDAEGNYDVWTIDLRTGKERRLTRDAAQDFQPSWSPDSRYIAFVSNRNATSDIENYDIFVMLANGEAQKDISLNPAPEIAPAWAPSFVKPPHSGSRRAAHAVLTCSNGTQGSDLLKGNSSGELICGKGGNDRIFGYGGNDEIYGGDGADMIDGGSGNDQIFGGSGQDTELGGTGADLLWSRDSAKDIVRGGPGAPGAALDVSKLRDPIDDVSEIP